MHWNRTRRVIAVGVGLSLIGTGCRSKTPDPAGVPRARPVTGTTQPPTPGTSVTPGPARAVVSPAGVILPVLATVSGGWLVRTPCHETTTLTRGTAVGQATVVLDPGHGGAERGAVAPSGLAEADVNLQVARRAEHALRAAGITVLLTRTSDYDVDLAVRAEIVRKVAPLAFVSVHHNAAPDRTRAQPGAEAYYQRGSADSKRLAGLVYEEVTRALSPYLATWAVYRDGGAQYRPGANGDYYAMLRWTDPVVGVLSESSFISDPPEAELLARPDVQQVEGEAVARGIVRYLTTKDRGSGFTEPQPRPDPPPAPGGAPPCRDPEL